MNNVYTKSYHKDFVFQNAATSTGEGNFVDVEGYESLSVGITGTSTSRTIEFKHKDMDGNLRSVTGVNFNGLTTSTATSGTDEDWQFNVSGLYKFGFPITAVGGGTVTIKGRLK